MAPRTGGQGPTGAAGTTRFAVGPFISDNLAAGDNATATSSTAVAATRAGVSGFVATRAGTVTGLSFRLNADPAGSAIVGYATINGTVQAASAQSLAAGSTRTKQGTFTGIAIAAGDVVGFATRTGSGWSATTADLVGDVEVTY